MTGSTYVPLVAAPLGQKPPKASMFDDLYSFDEFVVGQSAAHFTELSQLLPRRPDGAGFQRIQRPAAASAAARRRRDLRLCRRPGVRLAPEDSGHGRVTRTASRLDRNEAGSSASMAQFRSWPERANRPRDAEDLAAQRQGVAGPVVLTAVDQLQTSRRLLSQLPNRPDPAAARPGSGNGGLPAEPVPCPDACAPLPAGRAVKGVAEDPVASESHVRQCRKTAPAAALPAALRWLRLPVLDPAATPPGLSSSSA